jgi:stage V sporulation protein AD
MSPDDYDLIVTGDLGMVGHDILVDLMGRNGYSLGDNYTDCGLLLYDRKRQDVHAGGSGCGCIASVLSSYFIKMLNDNMIKRILAIGTGALLNPNSVFAQRTIPSIAHCVVLERD